MKVRTGTAVAVVTLTLVFSAWSASAADKPTGNQGPGVDEKTGKQLNEAVKLLKENHPAEARAALEKLDLGRLSPYALSRVEQLLGSIDQAEKKYASAREHFNKAVASGGLSKEEDATIRFQVAQLYIAEQRWQEGAEALKQWIAGQKDPDASAYYSLAVASYQLGDMQAASDSAQKAVDLAGKSAKEAWLQMLLTLRVKRQEYQLALPVLQQLIETSKK